MSLPVTHSESGLRFPTVRWTEGYAVADVDALLERCERALSYRDGSVTPAEVRETRFHPVRLRRGYQMAAVDAHLDTVAAALAAIAPSDVPGSAVAAVHCAGCRCAELGLV